MTDLFRISAAALAGIAVLACSRPGEDAAYGMLEFGSAAVTVTESDISRQAAPEVATGGFVLTLTSAGGIRAGQWTVDGLPENVVLPAGRYTVEASSPGEMPESGWDCPWYGASEEIEVVRDRTASVELVCRMANIKVTVQFDGTFLDAADGGVEATVTVGGNQLVFVPGETRAGYFRAAAGTSDMTVDVAGILNGEQLSFSETFSVSAGGWRNVTVDYKPVASRAAPDKILENKLSTLQ